MADKKTRDAAKYYGRSTAEAEDMSPPQREWMRKSYRADTASDDEAFSNKNTAFTKEAGESSKAQNRVRREDEKRVAQKKSSDYIDDVSSNPATIQGSYKKGGKVRKTGKYLVHSGERVLTKKQQAKSKKKQKTKR